MNTELLLTEKANPSSLENIGVTTAPAIFTISEFFKTLILSSLFIITYLNFYNKHASHFYAALDASIESIFNEGVQSRLMSQKSYANVFYNWQLRSFQWEQFLISLLDEPRALPKAGGSFFEYKP